ncbi:DUF2652 domain-containing protein [Chitinophagaceae bacterium LB-8]|uniref:DUF2652 domain-containing protein n=1 Tax=Paraflavisolibacter caeni TaxID=2982496 RepID=A0A9X2XPI5_9BACT|nr:DUF2652 domain-containing protein [Paraflavisolibacter caeni]MCU7550979.1 DUF2652 domain-containing protein [Paraflavisolibacter caeni]
MENRGLLFIPDISGFTRFVNEGEIEHSRLIIQELLEILINANELGLEVSEIEGDAILFYKFGASPDLKELYRQVEKMFVAFHKDIIAYDQQRFCQCKACTAAINLTLKVITHYGEFTRYQVKNFSKLIGRDVIVAHQLMKNDIEQHEYWLVTKNLQAEAPTGLANWMRWNSSVKQTESGEIPFLYTQLSQLKKSIIPESPPLKLELSKKAKVLSVTRELDTDIITLFHAVGDFHYRHRWQEGVKAVEEVTHFLPRIGTRCRCILENGQSVLYSTSYSYHPERIEFSETDEQNKNSTYFTLEKIDDKKTKLILDFYIKKNIVSQIMFQLTKKKEMEDAVQKSLLKLTELVKEIKLP